MKLCLDMYLDGLIPLRKPNAALHLKIVLRMQNDALHFKIVFAKLLRYKSVISQSTPSNLMISSNI